MACDICSKTGTPLRELKQQYQTTTIHSICEECLKDVEDHQSAIRSMQIRMENSMLKRLMRYKRKYSK